MLLGDFEVSGGNLAAQAIRGGIVSKRIALAAELFIQLRQITVRFEKCRRVFQRFLIRQNRCAFLLAVLENHS